MDHEEFVEQTVDRILKPFAEEIPPILFRNNPRFKELTGLSPRTMANIDSRGGGPMRVRVNTLIGYPRATLLAWMAQRMKVITRD